MKVLVTGANGFVGNRLLLRLNALSGVTVVGGLRQPVEMPGFGGLQVAVGDISGQTDWSVALAGVQAVVHTAARVHVMNESTANPLEAFRQVNVQGTLNLARQAAAAGIRRFVFVSSIKVNGEATLLGAPFTADDAAHPLDAYGVSKWEAELALSQLAVQTGMELVIIRPPLVYGPGVRANFARLVRCLQRGLPLPLGAIDNRRSLVGLDNLVDLLVVCLSHPAAAGQVFLVSDGEDVSSSALLRRMGQALGCPARLLPVPAGVLKMAATILGKGAVAQRLCHSLQVDMAKTRQLLGWNPPLSLDQGLKKLCNGGEA